MSLAQNSPVGTSELLPFGVNLYLLWDWRFREILLGDSSFLSLVGVYYASTFLGNYMNGETNLSPLGLYYASPFLGNYIHFVNSFNEITQWTYHNVTQNQTFFIVATTISFRLNYGPTELWYQHPSLILIIDQFPYWYIQIETVYWGVLYEVTVNWAYKHGSFSHI